MLHTAPQPPQARPALDADALIRRAFYADLAHDAGGIEIVAGHASPADPNQIELLIWTKDTYGSKEIPHTRKWFTPDQIEQLDRYEQKIVAQWPDVYISVGTYDQTPNEYRNGKLHYSRKAPRARRCFVLDDVQDLAALRLPPSWANETSPGNYQVGYRCTELLSAAAAQHLAAGAAELERCDPSGADAEQVIRIPTTRNTKAKYGPDGWVVRQAITGGPAYTPEALARAFLPGGLAELRGKTADRADGNTTSAAYDPANWQDADQLSQNLQRGGPLLTAQGGLRRLKADHFINSVLTGRTLWGGRGDPSYSGWRYNLMRSLWLHGYPEAEIRLLAEHLASDDAGGKRSTAEVRTDIDRILGKLALEHSRPADRVHPSHNLVLRPTRARQDRPRQKRGRPAGPSPARISRIDQLASLLVEGELTTRSALAQELNVTSRSITSYLATLQDQKCIELRTEARGLRVVRVERKTAAADACKGGNSSTSDRTVVPESGDTSDMESTPAPVPGCGAAAPPLPCPAIWHAGEADYPVLITGVAGSDAAGVIYVWAKAPDGSGSQSGLPWSEVELTPPAAPAAASDGGCVPPAVEPMPSGLTPVAVEPLPPAAATCEPAPAVVTLADLVRDCFDAYVGSRITWQRVARYVAMNAPAGLAYSEAGLRRLVDRERRRRRWMRQLVQLAERARRMRLPALKRRATSAGGRYTDLLRQGKEREASVWRQIAGVFEAEIVRRCDRETEDAQIDLEIARQAERRQPAPVPAAPAPVAAVEIGAAQERLPGLVVEEGGSSAAVPGTVAHLLAALVRQTGQRVPSRAAGVA